MPPARLSGVSRTRRWVLVAIVLAGCTQSNDDVLPPPPSLTFEINTVDVDASESATNESTEFEESTSVDRSGTAETAPPETVPAAPAPTTTTEPIAIQELLLRGDGIGSAVFGAEPEGVIDYVTSLLGGNTADTGWVDNFAFAACDGTTARRVDWGSLSLLFGDLSDVANGRLHFLGWEYGRIGDIGDEPVGLRTPGGTSLATRVVDLLAEFPDASVNPGEVDLNSPPNFYVSNNFRGLLTGVTNDDVVTVMFGGYGCGE